MLQKALKIVALTPETEAAICRVLNESATGSVHPQPFKPTSSLPYPSGSVTIKTADRNGVTLRCWCAGGFQDVLVKPAKGDSFADLKDALSAIFLSRPKPQTRPSSPKPGPARPAAEASMPPVATTEVKSPIDAFRWLAQQDEYAAIHPTDFTAKKHSETPEKLVVLNDTVDGTPLAFFVRKFLPGGYQDATVIAKDPEQKQSLIESINRRFFQKPQLRALRVQVVGPCEELERFSNLMVDRVGGLVNTLKTWWDGGYPAQDPDISGKMTSFMRVALSEIGRNEMVRVCGHLERGGDDLFQSCQGLIVGRSRRTPRDGPLEKAIASDNKEKIGEYQAYLEVVNMVRAGALRPLSFLADWRKDLGDKWVDVIIAEACEYLRHHVKAEERIQADEASRLRAKEKFEKSAVGKRFLKIQKKFSPDGLPKSRPRRFEILSNPEVIAAYKKNARLVPAENLKELLAENPLLRDLVRLDVQYQILCKPNTPKKWTPLTRHTMRWPFLDTTILGAGLQWKEGRQFSISTTLPMYDEDGTTIVHSAVSVSGFQTLKLNSKLPMRDRWSIRLPGDNDNEPAWVTIKGLRFDRSSGHWEMKISYEIEPSLLPDREYDARAAYFKGRQPALETGDLVCVFVLDPQKLAVKKGRPRAGWFRVLEVTKEGAKTIYGMPVHGYDSSARRERSVQRGVSTFFGGEARTRPQGALRATHGQTMLLSLPQLLDCNRHLRREIDLLKILKNPDRVDEAIEKVERRMTLIKAKPESIRKRGSEDRLQRVLDALRAGTPLTPNLLEPFKTRIKRLRTRLDGMKDNYRHSIAKQVVQLTQRARSGSLNEATRKAREQSPDGAVILVTEYARGKGPGKYKFGAVNRDLAVLGPSEVLGLVGQKAAVAGPSICVVSIARSWKDFAIEGETHGDGAARKTTDLAAHFLNPPPKKEKEKEPPSDDSDALEEPLA